MTTRFGIRGRLFLVMFTAILVLWLAFLAVFYVLQGADRAASLPTPGGLAALARAVEQTEPENRALILTAMQTETRSIRVVADPLLESVLPALWPADQATLDGYLLALDGRPLAVIPKKVEGLVGRRLVSAFNAVEFRIGLSGGETLVLQSTSPIVVAPIGIPVGFGAGLIGAIIALATLILLNRELRPLTEFSRALDMFDPEDADSYMPQTRARTVELRALNDAFGRLQNRLQTLTRSRMALIGGIQHDLRSFATRLRLRTELISDPEERHRAEADIADMVSLLDDAVVATRAEAQALTEELFEPYGVIAAEIADRQAVGADVGMTAAPDAQSATILGDRLAFRRIIANLIDNALRYGQAARVSLGLQNGQIEVVIDDEGPGIPKEERAFLLEPFARIETSRARATGGAGLGLAIVDRLVKAHDGHLLIEDAPLGGARLIVRIPVFDQ